MGTGVAFDDLAPGPGSIVSSVSKEPLHVSGVEGRGLASERAFREAFPNAVVTSIPIVVTPD